MSYKNAHNKYNSIFPSIVWIHRPFRSMRVTVFSPSVVVCLIHMLAPEDLFTVKVPGGETRGPPAENVVCRRYSLKSGMSLRGR